MLIDFNKLLQYKYKKTGVINYPLGQPTIPVAVIVTWFWSFGTDGRTICVKIVITTGRTVVGLVDQYTMYGQ